MIIPFTYNILKRHPALMVMIHRTAEDPGTQKGTEQIFFFAHSLTLPRWICRGRTEPQFDMCTRIVVVGTLLSQKPLLFTCIDLGSHFRGIFYEAGIFPRGFSGSHLWHGKRRKILLVIFTD